AGDSGAEGRERSGQGAARGESRGRRPAGPGWGPRPEARRGWRDRRHGGRGPRDERPPGAAAGAGPAPATPPPRPAHPHREATLCFVARDLRDRLPPSDLSTPLVPLYPYNLSSFFNRGMTLRDRWWYNRAASFRPSQRLLLRRLFVGWLTPRCSSIAPAISC